MNSKSVSEINLFDVKTQQCPYEAYKTLRNEAPVYQCPATGMYVITRFEDVRQILTDTEHFTNETAYLTDATEPSPRARRVRDTFEQEGWVPAKTLNGRDDPDHKAVRSVFNDAFRPKKIESLEEEVRDLAYRLIDDFIDDGECEWVKQFAIPLPLLVIGKQMGANPDDIWRIKAWTEAFFHRISLMQSEEEELVSVRKEIEAQHYFQPIFERLRREPNDTLLSDLVNTEIPEWGRCLTDNELHAEMMADTFVGGSETTTNALSGGVRLLIESPDQWDRLKSDPEHYLPRLVEEVLRLEAPVQRLMRTAAVDVEMHGVSIPKGSMLLIGYAAANRDDQVFADAERFDLDRDDGRRHVTFGFGTHYCMGAPLARRELMQGFSMLVERIDEMWFCDDTDLGIAPNYFLRALKELRIGFRAATT